jgi:hypothetical protein
MIQRLLIISFTFVSALYSNAQHLYYKNPESAKIMGFSDTLNRITIANADSNSITKDQFNYLLKFYPTMLVKNIRVEFKESISVAKTKPLFSSILKAPDQRVYKITFSKSSKSTLDSVLLNNLSFNSQLGLIAKQLSQVEDMSTGGFLDFVAWYFRQLTRRGKNKIEANAEKKTLEIGLGYQLLSLNVETAEKLNIDKWKSVKGYTSYVKYTKTVSLKPYLINDFINDLPFYVTREYK